MSVLTAGFSLSLMCRVSIEKNSMQSCVMPLNDLDISNLSKSKDVPQDQELVLDFSNVIPLSSQVSCLANAKSLWLRH
jgi:hypothetical protein